MLHISCNIGTDDLPDMYTLNPRALGIDIRQITCAYVTTVTYKAFVWKSSFLLPENSFIWKSNFLLPENFLSLTHSVNYIWVDAHHQKSSVVSQSC